MESVNTRMANTLLLESARVRRQEKTVVDRLSVCFLNVPVNLIVLTCETSTLGCGEHLRHLSVLLAAKHNVNTQTRRVIVDNTSPLHKCEK